ncbi:hypothetical protein HanRHA438_Chr13g0614231 [Helianthus annuus]|nr:hypothetical protein HanRHA438_Chr13g0614231 [Helianthus annuus]
MKWHACMKVRLSISIFDNRCVRMNVCVYECTMLEIYVRMLSRHPSVYDY